MYVFLLIGNDFFFVIDFFVRARVTLTLKESLFGFFFIIFYYDQHFISSDLILE